MESTAKIKLRGLRFWVGSWQYLKGHVKGPSLQRDQGYTLDLYTQRFQEYGDDIEKSKRDFHKSRLMVIDGKYVAATTRDLDIRHVRTHYEGIRRYFPVGNDPPKVLEIGAGYGRTLFPMAMAFPGSEFYGLEYTASGPESGRRYREVFAEELRTIARAVNPQAAAEPTNVREYKQGDGKSMPFADKTFDASYTNLVLEQIPYPADHNQIFAEARRVTKRVCGFLEPWADAQTLITGGFLKHNDYFRERAKKLNDLGFKNVRFYNLDFHANLRFRLGYVTAEPA